jgi:hypothetical protein
MAAIYQWFVADVQVWTTTLYPVEAVEGLKFSIDVKGGLMWTPPEEDYAFSYGFDGAAHQQILLTGPIEEDDYGFACGFVSAGHTAILLVGPTEEDDYAFSYGFSDAEIINKLITTYMPEQGLIFTIDVDSANCSMTDAP